MLKSMRMNLKSLSFTLWLVIFAFIGTTFLVWGIRSTPGGGMARAGIVAQIDKESISVEEYRDACQTLYEHYRKRLGDKFDEETAQKMGLKQRALDDLINQRLILKQARAMGVEVTDEAVAESIRRNPAFQENGQFSQKRYLSLLEYNRFTPQKFERSLQLELLLTRIQDLVKDAAQVSDEEVKDLYGLANDRLKVEFIELPSKDFQREQAESIASRMREKGGWEKVATEIKIKPRATGYLYYNLPFQEVPDPIPFIKTAFALKQGQVSPLVEGKERFYVMRASEVTPAGKKPLPPAQMALLKSQLQIEKRDRLLKEWLEQIKAKSKIQVEESLVKG
jgi:parvulin-like peptidyl-prolyl isomerase